MFWLQIAGGIALLAGIALIILGLFENPSDGPLGPAEPFEPYEPDSGYGSYDEYEEEEHRRRTEFGGVVMIGPIPIVFGNNTRAATLAIVLTIFLMLLTFVLFFFPWVR